MCAMWHFSCKLQAMITGMQIRSARAALGWSANQLAQAAGISLRTMVRMEDLDGVPLVRVATLRDVERVLEAAGIEFIGTPENGPGIRLHRPRKA